MRLRILGIPRPVAGALLVAALLSAAACGSGPGGAGRALDPSWLGDGRWEDGAARIGVFRGRIRRYGTFREAEVRDYLVREYLHPDELTKRDRPGPSAVPVLKANRMVSFSTGTYDYRRMASVFLHRRDGALVKAAGSTQDGCGLAFQRWDRRSGMFRWDTYWEGEGRGERALDPGSDGYFEDELPFVARDLRPGSRIRVLAPLTVSRALAGGEGTVVVEREGRTTRLRAEGGDLRAEFEYDDEGDLRAWRIPGREEFERVVKRTLYYWRHTAPGDEDLLRKNS